MSDKLTGLLSRKTFIQEANILANLSDHFSVVSFKIARFKKINDGLGDDLGDKILARVAKRLEQTFPHAALIGRMTGGNFSLLFKDISDENLEHQITLLRDFAERPILMKREVIVLSVNIGVADHRSKLADVNGYIHGAEVALHNALSSSIKVSYFHSDMKSKAKEEHELENALRVTLSNQAAELHNALHSNQLFLVFQPIIDIRDGCPSTFEALLRWRHPDRGIISPALFIPVAEKLGVMDVIGAWVLRRACIIASEWPRDIHDREIGLSVNISPSQLKNGDLLYKAVKEALAESAICPKRLTLEITESHEITLEMIDATNKLKTLGCDISLDDFGTGYSSLMQLNSMPIDYVKLDRSFISDIGGTDEIKERQAVNMVKAVVSLVDVFDLTPIAEGVETHYQLMRCIDAGINYIQGFYFSKPLEQNEVISFVNKPQQG